MVLIKIYGNKNALDGNKPGISTAIHAAVTVALDLPEEKKFHRFFSLEPYDFVYPDDKSEKFLIIEILMYEGPTIDTKKRLIRLLYQNLEQSVAIPPRDLEIIINDTPRHNWGSRGKCGDETAAIYKVEI